MKTCKCCGIEKPLEEFKNQKKGKNGKHSHCKMCINQKQREDYAVGYKPLVKMEETAPPVKAKFELMIGDKVEFSKSWEEKKSVGTGTVESISKNGFTVWTGKYHTSFNFGDKVRKVG